MRTKYIRPTRDTYGHTDIWDGNGKYLGYIIPDKHKLALANWHFVPKTLSIPPLQSSNRKDIIKQIDSYLK